MKGGERKSSLQCDDLSLYNFVTRPTLVSGSDTEKKMSLANCGTPPSPAVSTLAPASFNGSNSKPVQKRIGEFF
uniref:Uncharacterized protein n=1 Tax=Glossina austeni TaxID=7395 RepID=A0A1A9VDM1_GLOAU